MAIRFTKKGPQSVPDEVLPIPKGIAPVELPPALQPTPTIQDILAAAKPKQSILPPALQSAKPTLSQQVSEIMGTLPTNEKTQGFTQDMIDEALRQGIDIFKGSNLTKISQIEQAAQGNRTAQEQAIAQFLAGEKQPTDLTNQPVSPLQTRNPNAPFNQNAAPVIQFDAETRKAAAFAATAIIAGVATAGIGAAGLSTKVLKLVAGGAAGAGAVATPMKIVKDAKAALIDTVNSIDKVTEAAKLGILSPEQTAIELSNIQDQMNSYERSMKLWAQLSYLNFLSGGKELQVDITNAKRDYQIKRAMLLQAIAAGAIA